MIFIEHRINTLQSLHSLSHGHGAEIDLRTHDGRLILAHDPHQAGEDFANWLAHFAQKPQVGPLILNTKEDGLEGEILKRLDEQGLSNFLFLDTTMPTFIRYASTHGDKFMLRLSKHEPLMSVSPFAGRVKWLWVDCFEGIPLSLEHVEPAAKLFKLCLVSPELQGASLEERIDSFSPLLPFASAICTKHPALWKKRNPSL